MGNLATELSNLADIFRIALLTPVQGEGARKGALNKCLLQNSWLVNCDQQGSHLVAEQEKKMKVIPLTINAWNVHTLMDSSGSDRPQ